MFCSLLCSIGAGIHHGRLVNRLYWKFDPNFQSCFFAIYHPFTDIRILWYCITSCFRFLSRVGALNSRRNINYLCKRTITFSYYLFGIGTELTDILILWRFFVSCFIFLCSTGVHTGLQQKHDICNAYLKLLSRTFCTRHVLTDILIQ